MAFKVIFYYEPYGRELTINIPVNKRSDALKWVDNKIEKKSDMIPEGWTHWIIPNAQKECDDELYNDS